MPDDIDNASSHTHETRHTRERGRRTFLLTLSAAVFAAIGTTLATAALRFLRPRETQAGGGAGDAGVWTPLAPVSELAGAPEQQPLMRKIFVEHGAGWSTTREERVVYVLPGENKQVVSSICPHEGCEVAWRAAERDFFCPCHDSRFDAGGARLDGPARRDLERFPSRVENGVLQIQYRAPFKDSPKTTVQG